MKIKKHPRCVQMILIRWQCKYNSSLMYKCNVQRNWYSSHHIQWSSVIVSACNAPQLLFSWSDTLMIRVTHENDENMGFRHSHKANIVHWVQKSRKRWYSWCINVTSSMRRLSNWWKLFEKIEFCTDFFDVCCASRLQFIRQNAQYLTLIGVKEQYMFVLCINIDFSMPNCTFIFDL